MRDHGPLHVVTGPAVTGTAAEMVEDAGLPSPAVAPALPDVGQGPLVLDASFILALLDGEPAALALTHVLDGAVMSAVTAGEVFYKQAARYDQDPQAIHAALVEAGVRIVDLSVHAALAFPALRAIDAARRAEQKQRGEPAATLSLADLCVLAHALVADLPVLTGDRHWATLAAHGLSVPVHLFRPAGAP